MFGKENNNGVKWNIIKWLPDGEKKFEYMLIRFERVYGRDGRTDRRTDTASRHEPQTSRGKKKTLNGHVNYSFISFVVIVQ